MTKIRKDPLTKMGQVRTASLHLVLILSSTVDLLAIVSFLPIPNIRFIMSILLLDIWHMKSLAELASLGSVTLKYSPGIS